jgi:diguanylate cyclase
VVDQTACCGPDSFDDIDIDYATAMADHARTLMATNGIPPTPNNFAVWFQYCRGTWPQLNKTIDILLTSKRPFDMAANHSLHAAYVKQNEQYGSAEASDRLHKLLDDARGFLSTAVDEHRAQVQALGGVALKAQSSKEPLTIIASLVDELSNAITRTSKLEDRLANSTRELDEIRYSLYQAEQRAQTDALTGLANRHALDKFMRRAQLAAMETGDPLSILIIDIDHFKDFNDQFGHQTGDQVLRLIAQVLRESIHDGDLAARIGGEELMAVLPGADVELAKKIAELIRRSVAERPIVRRKTGELLSQVTVSIGIAQFEPGEAMSGLFERCDQALYFAKRCGRNRTVTESEVATDIVAA